MGNIILLQSLRLVCYFTLLSFFLCFFCCWESQKPPLLLSVLWLAVHLDLKPLIMFPQATSGVANDCERLKLASCLNGKTSSVMSGVLPSLLICCHANIEGLSILEIPHQCFFCPACTTVPGLKWHCASDWLVKTQIYCDLWPLASHPVALAHEGDVDVLDGVLLWMLFSYLRFISSCQPI